MKQKFIFSKNLFMVKVSMCQKKENIHKMNNLTSKDYNKHINFLLENKCTSSH